MISNRALQLPPRKHTYLESNGRLKDPDKYRDLDINKFNKDKVPQPRYHPTLLAHIRRGTDTRALHLYYGDMPEGQVLPIAGIIRDESDPRAKMDDAGPASGSGSGSASDIEPASVSISPAAPRPCRTFRGEPVQSPNPTDINNISDWDESSDLSELESPVEDPYTCGLVLPPLNEDKISDHQFRFQEDSFLSRPSVKLVITDHIKALLVDDWEFVTKQQQLVPLPTQHSVNSILNDYIEHERPQRQPGSAQADILEEVVAGLKLYFDKCLGRILLYR